MKLSYFSTDFVKELSFPRFPETEGERKAQDFLESELNKLNLNYRKEHFEYTSFFMNVLLRIYTPIVGTLIIFLILLLYFQIYTLVFIFSIILFILSFFSREILERLQFKCNKIGKKRKSFNYIIDLPAKAKEDSNQNIIVFAHYDSISHTINPILSGVIFLLALVGGAFFSIHIFLVTVFILSGVISVINFSCFFYGVILAGIFYFQLIDTKHNKSYGTIDNATGVANAFFLMSFFKENPLNNTNLIIVLTGVEELGDQGAYSFLKSHIDKLSKENSYFFIIDSVGGNKDKNLYFTGQGLPKNRYSPVIEDSIGQVLKDNKEKFQIESMHIPPLIHFSTDHAPLKPYGHQFMIFGSNGSIHSEKDNLDNYYPDMLENFNEFSRELILEMDKNIINHK